MSLKNKLNRLKPHISVEEKRKFVSEDPIQPKLEIPYQNRWELEHVVPYFFDENYCLIREVKYPLTQKHGHYAFSDFLTAIDLWNKSPILHPLSANGFRPEELFFFDTETTGLGGGVGNTIFLLGYASISGNNIVLRQHILPNPGAEVPLYQSFLEKVNYKTLVTYNGKAFDWPQVKTRHTLLRNHVPQLPSFGHFDLFHAAKRLWKHKLERMKLAIVEKEVLGIERVDDIPGYLAPIIYFDYIESKNPDGMFGILKHNEIDILSLITLYTHLTFQIFGVDMQQTRKESYEVGRWFAYLGEKNEAEKVMSKLVKGNDSTSYRAKMALAYQYKKEQKWEKSCAFFNEVCESDDLLLVLEACLELAKIYEHKLKNLSFAKESCFKAIEISKSVQIKGKLLSGLSHEQLQLRWQRLEKKLAKFPR
jgi:uncharacterized protein